MTKNMSCLNAHNFCCVFPKFPFVDIGAGKGLKLINVEDFEKIFKIHEMAENQR